MNSLRRTQTSVHSKKAQHAQHRAALWQGWISLSALHLYAQLLCGLCFYLYRHVSTPSYLSLLVLLLPLTAVYGISCRIGRKERPWHSPAGKCAALLLTLCLFGDAVTALAAITGLVQALLPDYNSLLIHASVLLCTVPILTGKQQHTLPHLAALVCIPLFLAILFVFPGTIRQGHGGNLFPLLGQGTERILTGALWMCGCLSPGLIPLLAHPLAQNKTLKANGCIHLTAALFFALLTALLAAFLMPFYCLAQPEGAGTRLMMFLDANTSLLAWSLTICGTLFLLLISLSCALQESRMLLEYITKGRLYTLALLPLAALPLVPAPVLQEMIKWLFPARGILLGLGLMLLLIGGKHP